MSRERDRIAKKREKNPIEECNKIQKRFYPELFSKFGQIKDGSITKLMGFRIPHIINSAHINEF